MAFKQEYRRIGINTPLGEDVLLLTEIDGAEEMSRLFAIHVRMISEREAVKPEDIVGKNVTIAMLDPDDEPHYINGHVRHFVNHGRGDRGSIYTAEIVPWPWFLTRRSDCRIFQEKTTPQIVEEVFKAAGFSDYDLAGLKGTYTKRDYCVQYRETDFDFVSRLMEEEGIFYYFRHESNKHVLVLGDDPGAYTDCKDDEVRFSGPLSFDEVGDNLTAWQHGYEFRSGRVALTDFNFETPQDPVTSKERTLLKLPGVTEFELYDYPGGFLQRGPADTRARRTMEAEEVDYDHVLGSSKCRSFGPGKKFKVTEHHLSEEEGRQYVLTRVHHHVTAGSYVSGGEEPEAYTNDFVAIPAATAFRPARITPKSVVRGPHTALVVGPSGEEIYVDKYGRVKVKFHWDRSEAMDDKASCWIRVSQDWAGKSWGAMFLPRIGQEVIVDFLEGDPDRPIITGRVYNANTTVPYSLPDNKNLSGIKTNSTKGGGGFNELRFDDTKGEEQVFVHAEKNMDTRVKNDAYEFIGHDRHLIVKNNQLEHVEMDRHTKVDRDDLAEVGRDVHAQIAGKEAKSVASSRSLKVGGDVIEVFQANQSTQVTAKLYVSAMNTVIEATAGLTIKCGGSSVVIDPSGVTVKGPMVTIDGSLTKINSGPGSPASSGTAGSLVSPTAPQVAEEADQADPGQVAQLKARQKERKTGKYGKTPPPQFKPKEPEKEDKKKTSWIEIVLVDEADEPVPGERYRLILPDGETVYEGTLDDKGFARVDGIDPGSCQITFPDLDRDAWEPA